MDRLDTLAFFIRIAEKRGVAAAGRDFGMSPATASERLAALEAYYGTTLFRRTTRSLSLTEAGKLLLERSRTLVGEAEDLDAQIKLGINQLSGIVRISVPHDIGQHKILPLIDEFLEKYPLVSVEVVFTDGYIDVVGQGLDLAIRLGDLKDSSLMLKKLGDNRRVICAAPSYIDAHGIPKHPNELLDHNCLIMKFGQIIDHNWPFNIDGSLCEINVSGNRLANSGAQVRRWCLAGKGIALKSIWDVQNDLEHGALVELLKNYAPNAQSALQILFPRVSSPPRRVRALIDFLVDQI